MQSQHIMSQVLDVQASVPRFCLSFPLTPTLLSAYLKKPLLCPSPFFSSLKTPAHPSQKTCFPQNNAFPRPEVVPPAATGCAVGFLGFFIELTTTLQLLTRLKSQQQESNSEQSASDIISSDENTTITPGSLFLRRPCPSSLWRRVIRRARQGRRRNQRLEFDDVDPHRGFSPPRYRQRPDWMR